ncbi:MAG: SUMF1/EgtB/PvdO family nonheme iron enzyme [Alphaproteobacteria bacterium]|nr:SUMF1/EgtB/PvdO family nonheme iron enzyme [Alphaproteobacteria bacterium]
MRSVVRSLGIMSTMATMIIGLWVYSVHAGTLLLPQTITVPAGTFIAGSDRAERDAAYDLDQAAYGHDRTRQWGWYDDERPRSQLHMAAFVITRTLITNVQYAAFIAATGHSAPDVDVQTWRSYGLIHPYIRTRRHAWVAGKPPTGRGDHPVVLVSHHDAMSYAAWLNTYGKGHWRLPRELEWEKAARGRNGHYFPWGNKFDAARLNSHDVGPFDTIAVGAFPDGASPYGLVDAAGQVFEWTATPAKNSKPSKIRYLVKGGSWDDKGCGVCRPAARHGRPAAIKHILIGFRLIRE